MTDAESRIEIMKAELCMATKPVPAFQEVAREVCRSHDLLLAEVARLRKERDLAVGALRRIEPLLGSAGCLSLAMKIENTSCAEHEGTMPCFTCEALQAVQRCRALAEPEGDKF